MSEMPAASRKATKMRGSAAGATILAVRCKRRKPKRARDLDQARLDAPDRRARQDQERPEAGERDDDDLEPVAEAERHQRDRDHRHRRDRPQQFEGKFQQAVERATEPNSDAEREAEAGADRKTRRTR